MKIFKIKTMDILEASGNQSPDDSGGDGQKKYIRPTPI
jgi:hypothetical protein